MTLGRPWVERVEAAVREAVEGHRGTSRQDHAEQDPDQIDPE